MSEVGSGLAVISRYLSHLSDKQGMENIYRGQSNTSWEPEPSVFRQGQFGIRSQVELNRWKETASRFERAQTNLEWLVLAQHYGVATALLDWTTNPLVALFFAAQPYSLPNTLNPANGAVFMIPKQAAIREDNPNFDVFSTWSGPPLLVSSGTMNRRSLAQSSVMTLHCDGNQAMTPGHNARIFIILAHEKRATLAALKALGIAAEIIYDDINTAAREFSDQLLQEGALEAFRTAVSLKK